MASRSYNPSPFPISNSIEDTLEYYNTRKNPNSQPMIFKYPERVVIRDTPRQDVGRLYGGNMKMLEMDATQEQRRPPGFVEPHSSSAKKYISNGNSASYPVFNAVEQKAIDTKKGGLMLLKDPEGWNKKKPDVVLNDKQRNALNAFGNVFHPKDPNLVMVGNGLWQDMNKWGKQNEENAKKLIANPTVQAIINDPRVQDLANKGKDLALAELKKKVGAGVKRGRGRPRKGTMEGEGIWEDMNAWGKQNERNFNKFGQDVERTAKGVLNNPQVQAIMNDPAVQKMGKSAVKTAVSYIPVVGPAASTALGLMGWGGVPRKEIVKRVMAEKNMSLIEASKYVKANNLYQPKPKTPRGKK
jgi:hypothetical protein